MKTLAFAIRNARGVPPVLCDKAAAKAFVAGRKVERVARILDGTRILPLGDGSAVYLCYLTREQLAYWRA